MACIPPGIFAAASALDVASHRVGARFSFPRAAFWLLALGVLGSVTVGIAGLVLDGLGHRPATALHRRATVVSAGGTGVAVISLATRWGADFRAAVGVPALGLGLVATGLVVAGLGLEVSARLAVGID